MPEGFFYVFQKNIVFFDPVVGRGHNHCRIGIFGEQFEKSIGYARCRVPAVRFQKNILRRNAGKLPEYDIFVNLARDYENVFGRQDFGKTVEGLLKKSPSRPGDIQKLLGHTAAAYGPESAADTTRHDHTVTTTHGYRD